MKIIGFLGIDKYDIIHYTSRILKKLGKDVLMIDASYRKALMASVPSFTDNIFDYNGVDFAPSVQKAREYANLNNYDYVLIDFGFQKDNPLIHKCDEVWFVSDMQKHNIIHLRNAVLDNSQPRFLILRGRPYKKVVDYLLQLLKPLGLQRNTTFLLMEENEANQKMLDCMYNDKISFKKMSKEMINVLKNILAQDFMETELNKAIKACKGGRL